MVIAWVPVKGYEGLYEVSSSGHVRSLDRWQYWKPSRRHPEGHYQHRPGRQLKPVRSGPYLYVNLLKDGTRTPVRIHVLVAAAFLGPRPAGHVVRHGPAGQQDNHAGNLSYGTYAENRADMIRDGTSRKGKPWTAAQRANNHWLNLTECPSGHPYAGTNLITGKRGNGRTFRRCRECVNTQNRARRQRSLTCMHDNQARLPAM